MTTPYITERTIEATLERLNAASPREAAALQKRSGRFHPELTAFVVSFTLDLRPDAAGLALYVMLVVYEAFRVSCVKLRKAKETTILRR